jgi:ribose transport system permease protein
MKRLFEQSWVWALLGTLVLWTLLSAGSGQVSIGSLSGILASAAVLCVVAIGQMLVVTTGDGAVDLSIPNVMTLSGFLATSVISGNDSQLIVAQRSSFCWGVQSVF